MVGFVAALVVLTSSLAGCDPPEPEHVELAPGTFISVITYENHVAQLGLTSARMFWEGEDQPIVIEYTSADDGQRYRVEYTIVGEELELHGT
ncbi:MAG TPA: hypothetical protein VIK91_04385 [Nannocystis sp.]